MDFLEGIAKVFAANIVGTLSNVTVSLASVQVDARMDTLKSYAPASANMGITAETVQWYARLIVKHVDTQMASVLVTKDGMVSIAQKNVINPMERIVSTIVITALTRYVIDLTEVVYMVVLTGKLAI